MSDRIDDSEQTIDQCRRRMATFVAERDWERFHRPKSLAMSIAIEAAELMEEFQWCDDEASRCVNEMHKQDIAAEMADVFSYLLSLANALDIDLATAFEAKMQDTERRYPVGKAFHPKGFGPEPTP